MIIDAIMQIDSNIGFRWSGKGLETVEQSAGAGRSGRSSSWSSRPFGGATPITCPQPPCLPNAAQASLGQHCQISSRSFSRPPAVDAKPMPVISREWSPSVRPPPHRLQGSVVAAGPKLAAGPTWHVSERAGKPIFRCNACQGSQKTILRL